MRKFLTERYWFQSAVKVTLSVILVFFMNKSNNYHRTKKIYKCMTVVSNIVIPTMSRSPQWSPPDYIPTRI